MSNVLTWIFIAIIGWAVIDQWRRNKDTVNTVAGAIAIGAVLLIVLTLIWRKATLGHI